MRSAVVTIGADNSVKDAHVYQSSGTESLDIAARRGDEIVEAQSIVTIDWAILANGVSDTRSASR